jgi:hypothetical protein
MSTEATGDGQPDAVGAVKPGAEKNAESRATAVAERGTAAEPAVTEPSVSEADAGHTAWDTGEATAWAVTEPASTETNEASPAGRSAEPGEPPEATEPPKTTEPPETGGVAADKAGEVATAGKTGEDQDSQDSNEADQSDAPVEASDESEDGEVPEDSEVLEDDEDYAGYQPDEAAGPQRARRWPRVLLALGFVVLAAVIVGGAVAIVGSLTHGFKKPVKITYKTSPVFSLKTGDCFDPQGAQSYTLISCDSPHQAEVFATFVLTGTQWPGDAAIQTQASGGCSSKLTGYVNPQLAISLSSTYVYPDSVAWQAGTRTVICEVRATSGQLTGSVRGAAASAG